MSEASSNVIYYRCLQKKRTIWLVKFLLVRVDTGVLTLLTCIKVNCTNNIIAHQDSTFAAWIPCFSLFFTHVLLASRASKAFMSQSSCSEFLGCF